MVKVKDFFSHINAVGNISDYDTKQLSNYIATLEAFARTTYNSIYVIDYKSMSFDYVSDNPFFLCGNTAEEVKEMSYNFYLKYVVKEDLELLETANRIGFDFLNAKPQEEKIYYTIAYDFRIKNDRGSFLINHKITPLFMTEEGKVWKALSIVSLSNQKQSGNIKMYSQKENIIWHYDLEAKYWRKSEKLCLNEQEKKILLLSIQGLTIKEIANEIFLSESAIKYHRKHLFEKLDVQNIAEAISFAINNRLL